MKLNAVRGVKLLKMQASAANKSQISSSQADATFTRPHCPLSPFPQSGKQLRVFKLEYCPFYLMELFQLSRNRGVLRRNYWRKE